MFFHNLLVQPDVTQPNTFHIVAIIPEVWQCRNPTLAKCGGEAQHLEKLEVGSLPGLPNVESSTERPKTPCIGVFLVSLERS
jgi:hypothetical protein